MRLPRPLPCALALVALAAPRAAAAQEPPPAAAARLPPGPPVVPPGDGRGLLGGAPPPLPAPPAYGVPPAYPPFGGLPPPAPPPLPPACCRWSIRYDPFDLILRRLTIDAEVAIAGPFALALAPSWIFGSPYGGLDDKGFSVAANAVLYLSGKALRGLWVAAHVAYENHTATLANPLAAHLVGPPVRLSSAILGALFGSSLVFGQGGGFALSGGVGVGVATAGEAVITAPGDPSRGIPAASATLYDGFDKVRLLGTLGLGVAF